MSNIEPVRTPEEARRKAEQFLREHDLSNKVHLTYVIWFTGGITYGPDELLQAWETEGFIPAHWGRIIPGSEERGEKIDAICSGIICTARMFGGVVAAHAFTPNHIHHPDGREYGDETCLAYILDKYFGFDYFEWRQDGMPISWDVLAAEERNDG